jgi:hypothetical protein
LTNRYKNHRFPVEIISHAVWLYLRFCLSYRDVEELLFAGGVIVTYEAIQQWCQKFSQPYANELRRNSRSGGRSRVRSWPPKGRVRCSPSTSLPGGGISTNKLTMPQPSHGIWGSLPSSGRAHGLRKAAKEGSPYAAQVGEMALVTEVATGCGPVDGSHATGRIRGRLGNQ